LHPAGKEVAFKSTRDIVNLYGLCVRGDSYIKPTMGVDWVNEFTVGAVWEPLGTIVYKITVTIPGVSEFVLPAVPVEPLPVFGKEFAELVPGATVKTPKYEVGTRVEYRRVAGDTFKTGTIVNRRYLGQFPVYTIEDGDGTKEDIDEYNIRVPPEKKAVKIPRKVDAESWWRTATEKQRAEMMGKAVGQPADKLPKKWFRGSWDDLPSGAKKDIGKQLIGIIETEAEEDRTAIPESEKEAMKDLLKKMEEEGLTLTHPPTGEVIAKTPGDILRGKSPPASAGPPDIVDAVLDIDGTKYVVMDINTDAIGDTYTLRKEIKGMGGRSLDRVPTDYQVRHNVNPDSSKHWSSEKFSCDCMGWTKHPKRECKHTKALAEKLGESLH
jgi:hypothetical protein